MDFLWVRKLFFYSKVCFSNSVVNFATKFKQSKVFFYSVEFPNDTYIFIDLLVDLGMKKMSEKSDLEFTLAHIARI